MCWRRKKEGLWEGGPVGELTNVTPTPVFSADLLRRHPWGILYISTFPYILTSFFNCTLLKTTTSEDTSSKAYEKAKMFSAKLDKSSQKREHLRLEHDDKRHFAPLSFTPSPFPADAVKWQQCVFSCCWRGDRHCVHSKTLRTSTAFSLSMNGSL